MTAWLPLLLPLAGALVLLAALGLPVAFALGARGATIALVSIPAAIASVALGSIALPLVGLPWNPLTALCVSVVIALALLALRPWVGSHRIPVERVARFWPVCGAAAIGGAAIGVSLLLGLKGADHVSQTYDAIFHLNAVRFVLDTGSASPFEMTLATAPGAATYYPTPWHATVALIVQLTGASIPVATNATVALVCSVIWPIGAVALGRAVAGPSTRATLAAGILAGAFPAFPLLLVRYGVLYPNLLATALVPYALVALLAVLNLGPVRRTFAAAQGTRVFLFFGATGAAALSHPNAFFALAILALLASFAAGFQLWQRLGRGRAFAKTGVLLALTVLCVLLALLWSLATTTDNAWEGDRSFAAAIWDALGSSPRLEGHAWILTVFIAFGTVLAFARRKHRWLVASYLAFILLFGIANGLPSSTLRTAVTGLWYNDAWRIAAILPLAALPLATLGLTALAGWTTVGLQRWQAQVGKRSPWQRGSVVGGLLILALAATQGAGTYAVVQAVSSRHNPEGNPLLLSVDEQTLLNRLDDSVPADALIATNPWNGSSLAYALSDRKVLAPHTGGVVSEDALELSSTLDEGGPRVCELAHSLGVGFVLDFGRDYVFPHTPRAVPYEGISGIEQSSVLTEVDREGAAVVYEITGCG